MKTIENMIRANAEMALDQRGSFDSLLGALDSYYENVRDTLVEMDETSALNFSFNTYRTNVRQIAKKLNISLPLEYAEII